MKHVIATAALALLQLFGLPSPANAAPQYCTVDNPYPPYYSVCNGYGQSCYLGFNNCSTVAGTPGTWNPDGYTPCQNQYGC